MRNLTTSTGWLPLFALVFVTPGGLLLTAPESPNLDRISARSIQTDKTAGGATIVDQARFAALHLPQTLSTTPDWSAEGNDPNGLFGNSVNSAGDVNGDGFDEVIVLARLFDNGEVDEGKAFLFMGSASGLELSPSWTFESDQAGAQVSAALSAGDVNGDGFDDVIVASGLYDNDQIDEGRVWLFLGSPAGLSTTAAWTMEGDQNGAVMGAARGGDVDGDGFADLLINAPGYDGTVVDEGRVLLFLGSSTGPSTSPAWIVDGGQSGSGFRGSDTADVNGDGYDDVIVSAQGWDGGETDEGRVFVYKGGRRGPRTTPTWILEINQATAGFGGPTRSAGDVNGDGFDDILVSALGFFGVNQPQRVFLYLGSRSGVKNQPALTLEADQPNAHFGLSVDRAGDVNGDGFGDVIIGARLYDVTLTNQGRAFVYAGSPAGLAPVPLQTFDGEQASEEFGVAVAGAGDVNGDGLADVIIGAHAFDDPEINEGRAVVFHGSAGVASTLSGRSALRAATRAAERPRS